MARREHEARTKRGGSAIFSTETIYRSERPSEDRKANKILNLPLLLQKFLLEFEGAFFKKRPQKKKHRSSENNMSSGAAGAQNR